MMLKTARSALVAATLVAVSAAHAPATAAPGSTARIGARTVEPNGATPPALVPDTTTPALSLDAFTVAFASDASNLVAGDTNGVADVFVRKLPNGAIVRASTTTGGGQANGPSYSPALSVDGRWLAFASEATNLVPGDTNGVADIFLKDLSRGTIRRVSVTSAGAQANGPSNTPFVSLFGDWVTFESEATNLWSRDANGMSDAFVHTVRTRHTSPIVPPRINDEFDTVPEIIWTARAQISYDGSVISYMRGATRASQKEPSALDVFVYERATRRHRRIEIGAWAGAFKRMNEEPALSADGRYVAFTSWSAWNNDDTIARAIQQQPPARNDDAIARNDLHPKEIQLFDRVSNTVIPLSTNPRGFFGNGDSYRPSITADGHQVAFVSHATNLVAGDTNGAADVFVRDLEERTVSRVSLGGTGAEANAASDRPSISYDGRHVAFSSAATNLVGGDRNATTDVFARDRRIDTANRAPRFAHVSSAVRGVNAGDTVRLDLNASDPDRDPLRFGAMAGLPSDATLDARTGVFEWQATPDPTYYTATTAAHAPRGDWKSIQNALARSEITGGREIAIVFWVGDPRGQYDLALVRFFVRDVQQSARCKALGHACYP